MWILAWLNEGGGSRVLSGWCKACGAMTRVDRAWGRCRACGSPHVTLRRPEAA